MKPYDHLKIEKKWQKEWIKNKIYRTKDNKKDKFYILDMFPYPSGEGLHVGHPRGYIGTDIVSRMKRMQGMSVLHPMGFDSFGLPAEQYAIKHKVHPEQAVKKNIKRYKEQLAVIGFDYDWEREVVTSDPSYYKWTQWIFLKLFEKGLAYQSFEPINWCPSCQTGLANEDLEHGVCERCGTPVEKKPMRQWVLKITDYADRLLEDLNLLDWPESIKESQRNWIGRSEGSEIEFKIYPAGGVKVFTTRADTLFGATYIVLAPEHKLLESLKLKVENKKEVQDYINAVKNKSDLERTDLAKEKTGVELKGIKAINPANGEELPVWIADYVLASYATGAIMAVPQHDVRDREFAAKYNLPIIDRPLVSFDEILKKVGGKKVTKYKLKDWVFSRQRYWGEPIPLIHCLTCARSNPSGQGVVPVPEKDLPVKLPKVKHYEPTGTGESPLAAIDKWVNVKCPKCKGPAKRETNTMPQWAGSSWYYLRYADPRNKKELASKKKIDYWLGCRLPVRSTKCVGGVDLYVGGTEHATRHLIYARFWHKFLFDIKVVSEVEPFVRLQNQGLIMASDGRKMSKRWGNVVNPDDIVKTYGADTLRVYEMFMGPFDQAVAWSTDSIMGARRFLEKVWRIGQSFRSPLRPKGHLPLAGEEKLLHKTIKKVTEDVEKMNFNTAISSMMILVNEMEKSGQLSADSYKLFLKLLAPFAPHITEELWSQLGGFASKEAKLPSVHLSKWPEFDPKKIIDEMVKIAVQVNGKVRTELEISAEASESEVKEIVLKNDIIKKWILSKEIKKFIYVKNKLANLVI